jgi:hypothetical protein
VVLLGIAADDARVRATRWDAVMAPVTYSGVLMLFLSMYSLGHAALYGFPYTGPVI